MQGNETSTNEYRVVGPPGCSKTTWLGQRVDDAVELGQGLLVTSLTKAAAAEISSRKLPVSFDAVGTLHSHCYHALGQPEIAEGKEHIEAWNEAEPELHLTHGQDPGSDRPPLLPRNCADRVTMSHSIHDSIPGGGTCRSFESNPRPTRG